MGLLDRWFGKKQEVSIEEKLRGEMQRLVKESIMYGLPGTPAPGTLDFPSFEDGFWTPAGYYRNRSSRGDNPQAYINEDDLKRSRERSRLLAACNEYARNALAVRQAYIVGTGIKTTVMPVKGAEEDQAALKLAQDVQQYLERWSALVKLPKLQKETVLRCDRDGETFLRSYKRDALELRFVEPEHVGDYDGQTPFGIVTDEDDITEVLAYLVRAGDGEQYKKVKAEEVTHIKCNTDSGIKRGLPFLFPIFTILERIEKVDENMAAVIAIQAAIAMIRRNPAQKSTAVSSAVSSNADFSRTNPYGGGTDYYKKYRAGTILDVDGNTEYEFPAIGANIGGIAEAKSSLLRTAAAGVCMAEYMITSDASNGNFASSQVAESPCISIFLATQHDFCEVFGNGAYVEGAENGIQWDAIEYAVEQGQLDPAALEMVVLKSVGPNIVVRDRTQETTRLSMLAEKGIISRDQWAKAEGEEKAAKSDEEVQAEKDAETQKQLAMAQAKQGDKQGNAGVKECNVTEQVQEDHDTGKEYGENCPVCGEKFNSQCRCMIGNRRCKNGHDWYNGKNGKSFLGTGHGGKAQAKSKPAGVKEQFDEDKHPRDDDGKFTSKGGEGEKSLKKSDEALVIAHERHWAGESVSVELQKQIKEAYNELPDAAKQLSKPVIVITSDGNSSYTMNRIYINASNIQGKWLDSVFHHEYAHHISKETKAAASSEFAEIAKATIKRAESLNVEDIASNPNGSSDKDIANYLAAEKMISALKGTYSDGTSDYLDRNNNRNEEIFATAFQNYMQFSAKYRRAFPEMYNYMMSRFGD